MAATASFVPPEVVLGTTTSWLPVTTAYPSVSGCADAFFLFPGQPFPVGWDPGYGYFAHGTLRCLPPQETSWWEQGHQNPDGYTSLSIQPIVCPAAFTTAATELRSSSSTLVRCCPSGYDLVDGQPGRVTGQCLSPLSSGQTITYTAQAANSSWVSTTLTVTAATSISAIALDGWNVAPSTTVAASTPSATLPSSTSTTVPTASHGLSTGAKAGIGIGVTFGVIALLCLAFLFLRGRRKQRPDPHNVALPSASKVDSSSVLQADSGAVHELHHKEEAPAYVKYQHPVELPSR